VSIASFAIHICQSTINVLALRGQGRKFSTYIRGYFFLTMQAFVLFNVLCNLFGYYVMVSKYVAEERRKFVAMGVGGGSLHKLVLFGGIQTIWGSKNAVTFNCNSIL